MSDLRKGILYYRQNIFPFQRDTLERLAREGQRPERLLIGCSDSRVRLAEVMGAGPGELFIVRNAGNIVPDYGKYIGGVTASIEYAVTVLPIREIIVCGHTYCGAIQAMLHPETVENMPAVKQWLAYATAASERSRRKNPALGGDALVRATVAENVLLQLEHLRTFPCVQERLEKGALKLTAWVFRIEDGEVLEHDPQSGEWAPIR